MKLKISALLITILLTSNFFMVTNATAIEYENKTHREFLSVKNYVNHSVIIICGGRGEGDFVQPIFERASNHAYKTFKNLSYSDDDIMYLCSNLSLTGVDGTDTLANISDAITNWLSNRMNDDSNYFIYMVDHGNNLTGRVTVSDGYIYPLDLKRWLDSVNSYKTGGVLINSCYSGKFIPYLTNPKRIIMTTTDDLHGSYTDFHDSIFQKAFFNELEKGASYGEAWMAGDKSLDRLLHYIYMPGLKNYIKYEDPELYEKVKNLRVFWFIYWMKWQIGYRKANPLIDDNGDGKAYGTWRIDRLPRGGDGNLALITFP